MFEFNGKPKPRMRINCPVHGEVDHYLRFNNDDRKMCPRCYTEWVYANVPEVTTIEVE